MKRLHVLMALLLLFCSLKAQKLSPEDQKRVALVKSENQWCPDLGNGFYKNPIVPGAAGNILAVKVGSDYYMKTKTGFNTLIFYHSRDLINWKPVGKHVIDPAYKTIWADDIAWFDGKFHIYMPIKEFPGKKAVDHQFGVFLITAEKIEGPWSDPIRVDNHFTPDTWYSGIDPGFVMSPEGKKYLYVDHGYMMPLNDDGTSSTAVPKMVYGGWKYPQHWVVVCECLEGPKLFYRNGYYYMGSAIGGDGNVSTSEMGIIARSKSPEGPWMESPYNPIVHTYSNEDPWRKLGHATILEGPEKDTWYLLVGGLPAKYENWGIGEQLLILPVTFTEDGWPVIKEHYDWNDLIPMPGGENIGGGMVLSDDFSAPKLGYQWSYEQSREADLQAGNGKLIVKASGDNSDNGTYLQMSCSNPNYEVSVEVACNEGVKAGLVIGTSEGLQFDGKKVSYNVGAMWRTRNSEVVVDGGKVLLKIRAYKGNISFFCSLDNGKNWIHFQNGIRGARASIRLFAAGKGDAIFSNFKYLGINEF